MVPKQDATAAGLMSLEYAECEGRALADVARALDNGDRRDFDAWVARQEAYLEAIEALPGAPSFNQHRIAAIRMLHHDDPELADLFDMGAYATDQRLAMIVVRSLIPSAVV